VDTLWIRHWVFETHRRMGPAPLAGHNIHAGEAVRKSAQRPTAAVCGRV
jgi:hypothetical protein